MRFSTHINNQKCIEWDLNANQGALFDLLNQASSWAKPISIDGVVFYWVARQKVIEELPLFYSKEDTVYRHFVDLNKKGVIEYQKVGEKDLIRLTEKGKSWNEFNSEAFPNSSEINPTLGNKSETARKQIRNSSEINPTLGNKSETARKQIRNSSDLDPTYNNTNYNNTNDHINNTSEQNSDVSKSKFKFSDDDLKAAHWIFGLIQKINPNQKRPNFSKWANDIRLMRDVDKHTHREICELFQFTNKHHFWHKNILSPDKLRKQWDALIIEQGVQSKNVLKNFVPNDSDNWADGLTINVGGM